MNDLMIFKNPEFGEIRTVELDGEPWLVGKDVAEALGYSNPRDALDRHVDDEDKAAVGIHDGSQSRNMTIINESGLYALVLSSKLPGAKKFRRWVTAEVLPSIRRHGLYAVDQLIENPDLAIQRRSGRSEKFWRRRERPTGQRCCLRTPWLPPIHPYWLESWQSSSSRMGWTLGRTVSLTGCGTTGI